MVEAVVPWQALLSAVGLIMLALGLLLLEFVVVSWGLLSVAAAIAALAALLIAWSISNATGWTFLLLTVIVLGLGIRIGLRWLRASTLVRREEIVGDAGYHLLVDQLGVAPGSIGTLVTDALPTGRARFGKDELDVQIEGASLPRGRQVIVLRVEGPTLIVSAAP